MLDIVAIICIYALLLLHYMSLYILLYNAIDAIDAYICYILLYILLYMLYICSLCYIWLICYLMLYLHIVLIYLCYICSYCYILISQSYANLGGLRGGISTKIFSMVYRGPVPTPFKKRPALPTRESIRTYVSIGLGFWLRPGAGGPESWSGGQARGWYGMVDL